MNGLVDGLNAVSATWWHYLFHATWQSSLAAVIMLVVVWLGRRWPSPLRYWLLVLALAKFAVPPMAWLPTGVFSRMGPVVDAGSVPGELRPITRAADAVAGAATPSPMESPAFTEIALADRDAQPLAEPTRVETATPAAPPTLPTPSLARGGQGPRATVALHATAWLLLAHLGGIVLVGGWMLCQFLALCRQIRGGRVVGEGALHELYATVCDRMGMARRPRLLLSPAGAGPISCGVLRPTVLLPAGLAERLSPDELQTVLAHELAHHRRGDLWINWAQVVLSALWWFNPLVWVLNRAVRATREDCCDDLVLARGLAGNDDYCTTLLHTASAALRPTAGTLALGLGHSVHPLGRRLRRIMDPALRRRTRLSLAGAAVLLALTVVLLPGLRSGTVRDTGPALSELPMQTEDERAEEEQLRQVRVRGLVRDRQSGAPIAGARLALAGETLETDAKGRFASKVVPGEVYVQVLGLPKPYLQPFGSFVRVPEDVADYQLPAIELDRGGAVRGTVVDDAGEPVAGASVSASWIYVQAGMSGQRWAGAKTNAQGEFNLDPVDPYVTLHLSAWHEGAWTAEPVESQGDPEKPVTLRISPNNSVGLSGLVVDTAGQAVANAEVEIWSLRRDPNGSIRSRGVVQFDGERKLHADAQGRFETPRSLNPTVEYRALVEADGMVPGQSDWLSPAGAKLLTFGDIVLRRLRSVSGRVVDRSGEPVAGALVRSLVDSTVRPETKTGATGAFQLQAAEGPALITVAAEGYRHTGQLIARAADRAELALVPLNEPADRPMRTLPLVMDADERREWAKQLLEDCAPAILEGTDNSAKLRCLETLARFDPQRVLRELARQELDPWFRDYLRQAVVRSLLSVSREEALTVAASMEAAWWRARMYLEASSRLPDSHPSKPELLREAVLQAQSEPDPAHRLSSLTRIADALLDLGDRHRATELIDSGRTVAPELGGTGLGGATRGDYAIVLARVDLPAALSLLEGLDDPARYHGRIAYRLAAENPAEAQRIFALIPKSERTFQWEDAAVRICYAMARSDPKGAQSIAQSIDRPYYKAHAYEVMAEALIESDRQAAARLLAQSIKVLRDAALVERRHFGGMWSSASGAAALLPLAERIDPQLVPHYFWSAVSLRMPTDPHREGTIEPRNAALAMMLWRYDRAVARAVYDSIAERAVSVYLNGSGNDKGTIFAAAAVIDPEQAVALVESLPDDEDPSGMGPKNRVRLMVANLLSLEEDELWQEVYRRHLNLWPAGDDDF